MVHDKKKIHIFYSWQSDLPEAPNHYAIRNAIRTASGDLESDYNVDIVLDEATRSVSGSPNIPAEIARKIKKAEIFVGDITSVYRFPSGGKSLPNSNVVFELGLAVAELGWNRVIMMFNEALADFENLPFDFDRHRIFRYKIENDKSIIKSKAGTLTSNIKGAIGLILENNPAKPSQLTQQTAEEIKRERDIINIRWFLGEMNTSYLNSHIQSMPEFLQYFAPVMHDALEGVVSNIDFRLYDQDLEAMLRNIADSLGGTLKYDRFYRELNNDWIQRFGQRPEYADRVAEIKAAKKIRQSVLNLKNSLHNTLEHLRKHYLEINIEETNRKFHERYRKIVSGEN